MAVDIKVLSAGAVQSMVEAIGTDFERASGHKVSAVFATVGASLKRIEAGEHYDLIALSESAIRTLDTPGRFVPGSIRDLGRTVTGIAVRTGTPHPDISTVEAFKATLLRSKSFSTTDPKGGGSSGIFLAEQLKKLGIADEVNKKTVFGTRGYEVAHIVARGEAELGTTFVSELLTVPGIEVVGRLPPGIDHINMYTAAIMAGSPHKAEAAALLAALTDPADRARWTAAGLEPAF